MKMFRFVLCVRLLIAIYVAPEIAGSISCIFEQVSSYCIWAIPNHCWGPPKNRVGHYRTPNMFNYLFLVIDVRIRTRQLACLIKFVPLFDINNSCALSASLLFFPSIVHIWASHLITRPIPLPYFKKKYLTQKLKKFKKLVFRENGSSVN